MALVLVDGRGNLCQFLIGVVVHQGSVLSPLLFILVMEVSIIKCRVGGSWELLYEKICVDCKDVRRCGIDVWEWRQALEKREL